MVKKRGGKREGAGRKTGSRSKQTIAQEEALDVLRKMIREKWGPLLQAKIDLASGLYVFKFIEVKDKKGKTKKRVKVYRKNPQGKDIEDLISRVVGKPKEYVEVEVAEKVDPKELEDFIKWRKKKKKKSSRKA